MESLHFEGSGWEYFKIWIVNILLVIITFGFYYPWAKVRNRRYFYANTLLNGRNFEYLATGKQLFWGYVIALLLFILFSTVQNISPKYAGVFFLGFFTIMPWIIWRSLMFNLRMSAFSNVPFSFTGKLTGAYFIYLVLPILLFIALYAPIILAFIFAEEVNVSPVILTIGILLLLAAVAYFKSLHTKKSTHYLLNHYQYGQGKFTTSVETKEFIRIWLKSVGVAILSMFVFAVLAAVGTALLGDESLSRLLLLADSEVSQDLELMQEIVMGVGVTVFAGVYIAFLLLGLAVLAYSITRQRSYIYANTQLDDQVSLNSTLRARDFLRVMGTNFILVIVTLGLAIPWAKVRMARLLLENTQVDAQGSFDDYLAQLEEKQSALGDQIGDTFDIDVDLAF